jgi:hypothetical protein
MTNYRKDYTNRVLFLTDGRGESDGILEMAERYKQMGINVSTIGVGANFDVNLMVDLAREGGGSSRFISDSEEMEKTFGSELDRMVVPVARDLKMRLELPEDAQIIGTWGYDHRIEGDTIHYNLSTLHHRDYETILVHLRLPLQQNVGKTELARFQLSYKSLEGESRRAGPLTLNTTIVDTHAPVSGFSNGMVLRSGTMMRFALALIDIGELYYTSQKDLKRVREERDALWKSLKEQGDQKEEEDGQEEASYEELTSPAIESLEASVLSGLRRSLRMSVEMKKELNNVRMRLDNEGFEDEIGIMENYIKILGKDLELKEQELKSVAEDNEIRPAVEERPLMDHLENLFREITLDLDDERETPIAVSGFTIGGTGTQEQTKLISLLNEMAVLEISKMSSLKLIERERLDEILKEQELSLTDLMDTNTAIRVGNLLSARLILTGSVIEMSKSVVIFGRIINVETGEIESVSQVIIPKGKDIVELLSI